MKHQWITALVAVSLIGTGQAIAEKGKGQGKKHPSQEEMRKKILKEFDADGDGKLNESEKAKAKEAMKKRRAKRFAEADKNNDGKLTEDEVPAKAWKRMSKADKDGNGEVTKEELAKAHAAHNGKGGPGAKGGGKGKHGPPPIEQFDKNKDGKLSEDEVPAEVWARMSKADKNADGFVSKKELEAAHKKRKGAKGGDKGKKKKKEGDS